MAKRKTGRASEPAVVSTHCSNLMSYLPSFRRALADRRTSSRQVVGQNNSDNDDRRRRYRSMQVEEYSINYWEKVRRLELEVLHLSRWLQEEKSFMESLECCANNCCHGPSSLEMKKLVRLRDGGYIRGILQHQKPWQRLFLQTSEPGIAEFGSTFSEVITKMASIGAQNLEEFLRQSIPIANIRSSHIEQSKEDHVRPGFESSFMEAILSDAVEKLGCLALQGLRIQVDRNPRNMFAPSASSSSSSSSSSEITTIDEPFIVMLVLMQVRDGMEDYVEVGDRMIGVVEVSSMSPTTGEVKEFEIEGLHVAGMASGDAHPPFIWSGSSVGKKMDGCCCSSCYICLRNEDLPFSSH